MTKLAVESVTSSPTFSLWDGVGWIHRKIWLDLVTCSILKLFQKLGKITANFKRQMIN